MAMKYFKCHSTYEMIRIDCVGGNNLLPWPWFKSHQYGSSTCYFKHVMVVQSSDMSHKKWFLVKSNNLIAYDDGIQDKKNSS